MSRRDVLAVAVPPWQERRRQIESEPLPPNVAALLDEAAAEVPDKVALDFFEDGERLTYGELRQRVNPACQAAWRVAASAEAVMWASCCRTSPPCR